MMDNTVILVDFDHTLFDTGRFAQSSGATSVGLNYKDFLYPDVFEFINYASKFGELTLFSEGEVEFQKEKIEGCGIKTLFSGGVKVFPSHSKADELLKISKPENIILIDDNPEVVDKAISLGCRVIRVKRGKHEKSGTKKQPEFTVENLSEIVRKNLLADIVRKDPGCVQ